MFKSLRPPAPIQSDHLQVLMVEDQHIDRARLTRYCKALGMDMQITTAATLAHGARALAAQTFDLIFLDYMLPDGTGLDALHMIRLSARNCTAATIMITGQNMEGLATDALRGGCNDYITKDELKPATLKRAVNNALQKSVLARDLDAQAQQKQTVEAVLQAFSTQCARDIKPMVSRMMRQLRSLRAAPQDHGRDAQRQAEDIETSCMQLWEFLVALERHQNPAPPLVPTELTAAAPNTAAAPSLFGRA